MKLFARYFLILMLFAILPLTGAGLWMLSTRRAVHDNARLLHERLAAMTADQAERELEQLNQALSFIEDVQRAQGNARHERTALNRASHESAIIFLSVIDKDGQETPYLVTPDAGPRDETPRASEAFVKEAFATNRLTLGPVRAVDGMSALPVAHPLLDGRCVYVVYSLRGLSRRMKAMGNVGNGRLLFVDSEGRPVPDIGGTLPGPNWVFQAESSGTWHEEIPGPYGDWVAATAQIPAVGWTAVSMQPRRDAYAEKEAGLERAVLFFAMLLCLVSAGAYVLSRRLVKPIEMLLVGAARVAANDFSRSVPPLGAGEFEKLRVTFNEMADRVGRYQKFQFEKILEEKAKVDALVRNIPEGVVLVGRDGKVLYYNAIASRVLRVGVGVKSGSPEILRVPELMKLAQCVKPGSKEAKGGVELRFGEGASARIFTCLALSVSRETEDVGVLLLLRDVTVERELERMKVDFFHEIVHDLRGPLTVIDGMVSIQLRREASAVKDSGYLKMVKYASMQLSGLVSDILDVAKMNSGTMKVVIKRVKADALVHSVQSMYQIPAETKKVTVVAEAESFEFDGDAGLIERVLMNLAGNALKFTPEGGKVTIGCRRLGADAEFSLSDTGPGIPVDQQKAVFDRFKQLDRDEGSRKGYGLGLSICRRIVELHAGRIWVESAPGGGSRFVFVIPDEKKSSAAQTAAVAS